MSIIELLALALALAMDAFAVALASGVRLRCTMGQTMRMALAFGLFQFAMPVCGWFLGLSVRSYIEAFDHWAAFGLLAFVGARMLREGLSGKQETERACADPTRGLTLLMLALATSIDALAVGISMAMLAIGIWYPAAVIGLVCFGVTALGMHLGRAAIRVGPDLSGKANLVGGLVLIGIGVKILLEHLLL
jgi:putative Mn2+ efflux pump MntP